LAFFQPLIVQPVEQASDEQSRIVARLVERVSEIRMAEVLFVTCNRRLPGMGKLCRMIAGVCFARPCPALESRRRAVAIVPIFQFRPINGVKSSQNVRIRAKIRRIAGLAGERIALAKRFEAGWYDVHPPSSIAVVPKFNVGLLASLPAALPASCHFENAEL
jgi:hypothetical protein